MREIIGIWINCPSVEVADEISSVLLTQRLVACCNRFAPMESCYVWKGKIETEEEIPLLVKTRRELFDSVVRAVRPIHPYETPAIYAVDIAAASDDYIDWAFAETAAAGSRPDQAERSTNSPLK
ncbi:MAG: divalent-cation tolerance protein CutA [Pseudomonadota bacterium]